MVQAIKQYTVKEGLSRQRGGVRQFLSMKQANIFETTRNNDVGKIYIFPKKVQAKPLFESERLSRFGTVDDRLATVTVGIEGYSHFEQLCTTDGQDVHRLDADSNFQVKNLLRRNRLNAARHR